MAQWGKTDVVADAPTYVTNATSGASGQVEYTQGKVLGISPAEAALLDGPASPGWVRIINGTGPLASIAITAGGSGYTNADTFTVTSVGGVNATGTIAVTGGVITSLTITNTGSKFVGNETVTITTVAGISAVLTPKFSGRAGRKSYETLVAMRKLT